jgi:hypothetical protein
MAHVHTWVPIRSSNRFRCACGIVGHAPALPFGQLSTSSTIDAVPYRCQHRKPKNTPVCGKEATHVTHDRQASRCAEHAPKPQQDAAL